MSRSKDLKIPFNKFKLILFFIGSLGFVVAGIFLLIQQPELNSYTTKYDWLGRLIGPIGLGWAAVLFFGATAILSIFKLFFQKYSVIITEKELISNSIGFRSKIIPLHLIRGLEQTSYKKNEMIRVEYLKPRGNSDISHSTKKTYINKNTIKFNFEQLFEILQKRVNISQQS